MSVDTAEASQLPGMHAGVTPFDIPPGRMGPDMGILDTRVRFVGDEVAAVAADDPDTARAALALIRVEYGILPHYASPEAALAPDAIPIHPDGNLALGQVMSLERGSVAEGFAAADVVLEDDFEIATHSATPLEPRVALASWGEDDDTDLTVWKTTRGVHVDRDALASALGLSSHRVRVVGPFLGAGYGNKDETRLAGLGSSARSESRDAPCASSTLARTSSSPGGCATPPRFTSASGSGLMAASRPSRPAHSWTPVRIWPLDPG